VQQDSQQLCVLDTKPPAAEESQLKDEGPNYSSGIVPENEQDKVASEVYRIA
jgi:peptide methionine sulfoxide reductase MsrA